MTKWLATRNNKNDISKSERRSNVEINDVTGEIKARKQPRRLYAVVVLCEFRSVFKMAPSRRDQPGRNNISKRKKKQKQNKKKKRKKKGKKSCHYDRINRIDEAITQPVDIWSANEWSLRRFAARFDGGDRRRSTRIEIEFNFQLMFNVSFDELLFQLLPATYCLMFH